MTTETTVLEVAGLTINVVRKDIKNLHLGVYRPSGRVPVAAPLMISDEAVRLAVIDKLAWIGLQRAKFAQQPRQSRREMESGESHHVFGQRRRLRLWEADGKAAVATRGIALLDLFVRPGTAPERRAQVLAQWYRDQLRTAIAPLLDQWRAKLEVGPFDWGVKRMKTKWGSCTAVRRRLWFNTELAKKPITCIEYIVVHEMLHLVEPSHSEGFVALMDRHLPRWPALNPPRAPIRPRQRRTMRVAHWGAPRRIP